MNIQLKNEFLTVTVNSMGAELRSVKGADGTEYLWRGDAALWGDHAPVLFPICGRLTDGYCTVNGERYAPEAHGFFQHSETAVTGESGTSLTLTLEDSPATRALYPFPFRLDMTYELEGRTLTVRGRVTNRGAAVLPFALGLHPGFSLPFAKGTMADYTVRFVGADGSIRRVNFDENEWFPIGGTREFPLRDGECFDPTDAFFAVGSAFFEGMPQTVRLEKKGTGRRIAMHFPDYRYFGLWKLPGGAFLCMEPWTSLPPLAGEVCELTEKPDLIRLGAGESRTFVCTVEFQ